MSLARRLAGFTLEQKTVSNAGHTFVALHGEPLS
jgi:hypothetical protein